MALQICSNGAQQNAKPTSLAPSGAHRISLLNNIRFHLLLEALDNFRVDRLTSSIFYKFARIFRNINAFDALVLGHTQVLYGAALLSFIYYEF